MVFRGRRVMTDFERVRQWLVFGRQWHLVDATGQDLDALSKVVGRYLIGAQKPIYHPAVDCGDHVVVINCKDISLRAFDWRRRDYFYDTQRHKGKALLPAYEIHRADPCRLMAHETYARIRPIELRRAAVERLHLYPDDDVHHTVLNNVSNQIPQVNAVTKAAWEWTEEERAAVPRLLDLPDDHPANEHLATDKRPL